MDIRVEEVSPIRTRLAVGYGKEEKLRYGVELSWLGVLGGPGTLTFEARRTELEPFSFTGRYRHPDLILPRSILELFPYFRLEKEPAYEANRNGFKISFQQPLFSHVVASVGLIGEFVDLDTTTISDDIDRGALLEEYGKAGILLGFARSTGRPAFDPRSGNIQTFLLSFYGPGEKYPFTKMVLDLRWYFPLTVSGIFAVRIKNGIELSQRTDDFIPVEERFFAGGVNSVRGWRRFQLGPVDAAGTPTGGSSLLEGGVEFRHPIIGSVHGAVFLDLGNVWTSEMTFKLNELRYSAGLGIRFATPVGPFRLDAAVPIFDEDLPTQFMFSVGHAF